MTPWGEDDVDRAPAPASAPSPGGLASPTPSALVSSRPTPSARPHVRRRAIRTAVDLRTLRLCKYFLPHWHDDGASTRSALFGRQSVAYGIRHLPFHAVPWRSVALRVLHCEVRGVCWCVASDALSAHALLQQVPPSQMLYAFNAALVGLCVIETPVVSVAAQLGSVRDAGRGRSRGEVDNLAAAAVSIDDCPRFLTSTPLCDCVGLGTVLLYECVPTFSPLTDAVRCVRRHCRRHRSHHVHVSRGNASRTRGAQPRQLLHAGGDVSACHVHTPGERGGRPICCKQPADRIRHWWGSHAKSKHHQAHTPWELRRRWGVVAVVSGRTSTSRP